MEHLDFGWGFGAILIAIASIYAISKGILFYFLYYLPSNWLYKNYLKTGKPIHDFFRFYFSWAIFISVLIPFKYYLFYCIEYISPDFILQIFRDLNTGRCFHNFLLLPLLFWNYSFEKNTKKLNIIEELNAKKKFLRFLLYFIIICSIGYFFKNEDYSPLLNYAETFISYFILGFVLLIKNINTLEK